MESTDITFVFDVSKPPPVCYQAWTTNAGLQSFFSPNSRVELRPGGAFEILFDMDQPEGSRGSEGMMVMGFEPDAMINFSWNSPPSIPELRSSMTMVQISFMAADGGGTHVVFRNIGYGSGAAWLKAREYFVRAWGKIVLPRFISTMEEGVTDWDHPRDTSDYALEPKSE